MYYFGELLYYLMIDATFIIPNNAAGIYQSLSNKFSAIKKSPLSEIKEIKKINKNAELEFFL